MELGNMVLDMVLDNMALERMFLDMGHNKDFYHSNSLLMQELLPSSQLSTIQIRLDSS